jgi:hypothetical protein
MAISRLSETQAFEPAAIAAITSAYEDVLRSLGLADRTDQLTEIVAERIIQFAQGGEHNPARLRDLALGSLGSA